jgi:hypothetical protein
VLRHEPTFGPAATDLSSVYAELHECDKALALIHGHWPHVSPRMGDPTFAKARCGETAAARAELNDWHRRLDAGEFFSPFQVAVAYAGIGDADMMFHWLDRAVAERDWQLFMLATYPPLRDYRSDPRFRALLPQIHLVPSP